MSSDADSEESMFWGSESEGYPSRQEEQEILRSPVRLQASTQPRPRLTSPRLFPREGPFTLPLPSYLSTFSFSTSPGAEARNTRRLADEANQRILEASMQDVLRATESANRALQTAQEAFELPPIVDLTGSTPSRSPDVRRSQAPPVFQPTEREEVFHFGRRAPESHPVRAPPFLSRPADPTGRSLASLEEVRRQRGGQGYLYRRNDGSIANMPPIPDYLEPRPPTEQQTRIQDERAVQRQREARMLWDYNARNRPQPRRSPTLHAAASPPASRPSTSQTVKAEQIESVDLTAVDDDPVSLTLALAHHRRKTSSSAFKGTALSSYKCPICMEPPTDATTTICGHLFCHRCIIETLKWSEEQRLDEPGPRKSKGLCPVCRTAMDRRDTAGAKRTLVPLELLLMVGNKRKREDKGKEVVREHVSDGKENIREGKKRKERESTEDLFGNFTTI